MPASQELVVFDLDGTLLDKDSRLSDFTLDTLKAMDASGVDYTIATGRSFQSASVVLGDHSFLLPHIYTNGALIWCPNQKQFDFDHCLSVPEAMDAIKIMQSQTASPFASAFDGSHRHYIFHDILRNDTEKRLIEKFSSTEHALILPLEAMATLDDVHVTNISMIGPAEELISSQQRIETSPQLIAYSGSAMTCEDYRWLDVHHNHASKGRAVVQLKQRLNIPKVICFGDSDNDLSMFTIADECYAPENAKSHLKALACQVIGHHHENGVAEFLRDRFNLAV